MQNINVADHQFNLGFHKRVSTDDLPPEVLGKVRSMTGTWIDFESKGTTTQECVCKNISMDVEEVTRKLTIQQVLRSNNLIQENRKKSLAYHAHIQKCIEISASASVSSTTTSSCRGINGLDDVIATDIMRPRILPTPALSVLIPVGQPLIADVSVVVWADWLVA